MLSFYVDFIFNLFSEELALLVDASITVGDVVYVPLDSAIPLFADIGVAIMKPIHYIFSFIFFLVLFFPFFRRKKKCKSSAPADEDK